MWVTEGLFFMHHDVRVSDGDLPFLLDGIISSYISPIFWLFTLTPHLARHVPVCLCYFNELCPGKVTADLPSQVFVQFLTFVSSTKVSNVVIISFYGPKSYLSKINL